MITISGAGNEELDKCHSWSITSNGPLKCLLLGSCLLWEEWQRSGQLLSTVVLVLCIWCWLPLPYYLGSDPLLAGDGSLRSSENSGSDPFLTSLTFTRCQHSFSVMLLPPHLAGYPSSLSPWCLFILLSAYWRRGKKARWCQAPLCMLPMLHPLTAIHCNFLYVIKGESFHFLL